LSVAEEWPGVGEETEVIIVALHVFTKNLFNHLDLGFIVGPCGFTIRARVDVGAIFVEEYPDRSVGFELRVGWV
jgi:hypothetical protein